MRQRDGGSSPNIDPIRCSGGRHRRVPAAPLTFADAVLRITPKEACC